MTCADARRMLSHDSNAAHETGHSKRRTHLRHPRPPSYHVRPILAFVALAVVALLLFSADARANLVEEVPLTHWSYQALERLAAAGFVDPKSHSIPSNHALTRFQLASAAREALAFASVMTTGANVEGVQPRRELSSLLLSLDERLAYAAELDRQLSKLVAEAHDGLKGLTLRDGALRFSQGIEELQQGFERLTDQTHRLFPAAKTEVRRMTRTGGSRAANSSLDQIETDQVETLILQARTMIEHIDSLIDGVFARLGDDEAPTMPLPPSLSDYVSAYVAGAHGEGHLNMRAQQADPQEIVSDLKRLAQEFAADIERLGGFGTSPRSSYEHLLALFQSEPTPRPGLEDQRTMSKRGVSLDAIIATLESGREVVQRSVGFPLSAAQSTPATARVERGEGAGRFGSSRQSVPTAEYGFEVLGLRMTTSLSMDEQAFGETSVPTARLQASLPLPGDRGEIEAGYSVVDIDRLREISKAETGTDGRRPSGRRAADEDGRSRFHVTGVAPLGDAVSIRVGYELRAADETTSSLEGVVGAGLEYRLGERGNVTADLRWSPEAETGPREAGVGFGYRLGENTSLIATYSMITFESAKDALTSGLGEAELEVRF